MEETITRIVKYHTKDGRVHKRLVTFVKTKDGYVLSDKDRKEMEELYDA